MSSGTQGCEYVAGRPCEGDQPDAFVLPALTIAMTPRLPAVTAEDSAADIGDQCLVGRLRSAKSGDRFGRARCRQRQAKSGCKKSRRKESAHSVISFDQSIRAGVSARWTMPPRCSDRARNDDGTSFSKAQAIPTANDQGMLRRVREKGRRGLVCNCPIWPTRLMNSVLSWQLGQAFAPVAMRQATIARSTK